MLAEVLAALEPRPGGRYVDLTGGGGGHTRALLERVGPEGRVLALDQDPEAIVHLTDSLGSGYPGLIVRRSNFAQVDEALMSVGWERVDGMVLDLGVSSNQIERSGRGFSFDRDEPLDMRMDPSSPETAMDLVMRLPEGRLADLIYQYGEERGSRRVARAIVWARNRGPIRTSRELAQVVRRALGRPGPRPRMDLATRTFQALRIAVNRELDQLALLLTKAAGLLQPGGRLAAISFHSLEDRLLKQAMIRRPEHFDASGGPGLLALYKKPVTPSAEELAANPRSRSAKLRVGTRVG
jgi:16S rRNA (cytosine1402-N4)-methyltransferase